MKKRNEKKRIKEERAERKRREKGEVSKQLCTTHKISLVMFLSKHEHPSCCVWLLKFVVDGDQ